MDIDLNLISTVASSAILGAITVGLTSVVAKWLPRRVAPGVALVIGVALVLTVVEFSMMGFWAGIALGLVSMGLYDIGAKMILGK